MRCSFWPGVCLGLLLFVCQDEPKAYALAKTTDGKMTQVSTAQALADALLQESRYIVVNQHLNLASLPRSIQSSDGQVFPSPSGTSTILVRYRHSFCKQRV
jgi:hypothetical protein